MSTLITNFDVYFSNYVPGQACEIRFGEKDIHFHEVRCLPAHGNTLTIPRYILFVVKQKQNINVRIDGLYSEYHLIIILIKSSSKVFPLSVKICCTTPYDRISKQWCWHQLFA